MNVGRNKHLLLWTSLATLVLLVGAALRENVASEWRVLQRGYRARLAPEAAREFNVQLRQVYVPAVGAVDRCVSCHVGMASGRAGSTAIRSTRATRGYRTILPTSAASSATAGKGGRPGAPTPTAPSPTGRSR